MARSWEAIAQADAVLFLHDLTRVDEAVYAQADADIAARLPEGVPVVHVFNKADAGRLSASVQAGVQPAGPVLALSAKTGDGLQALRQTLLDIAGWQAAPEGVFIARQRHVQALRTARAHLESAQAHAALNDGALDLLAEELRLTHNALGTITGAFSADDLLGEIFTRFCIGK